MLAATAPPFATTPRTFQYSIRDAGKPLGVHLVLPNFIYFQYSIRDATMSSDVGSGSRQYS